MSRSSATGKTSFGMGAATMPRQTANTKPLASTGTGSAKPTLKGCPLALEKKCGLLHVSSDAALVAGEPPREHSDARSTSKYRNRRDLRREHAKLEPRRDSTIGDLARLDVQVPAFQRMLDLVGNSHAKGKQSVEDVASQLIVKGGHPTDARDMVAEPNDLESTELGFGRQEKHALISAQGDRGNQKQGSFEPAQG